jgi:hypothetical protein
LKVSSLTGDGVERKGAFWGGSFCIRLSAKAIIKDTIFFTVERDFKKRKGLAI